RTRARAGRRYSGACVNRLREDGGGADAGRIFAKLSRRADDPPDCACFRLLDGSKFSPRSCQIPAGIDSKDNGGSHGGHQTRKEVVMTDEVTLSVNNAVAEIVLDRPRKLNAVTPDMAARLAEFCARVD